VLMRNLPSGMGAGVVWGCVAKVLETCLGIFAWNQIYKYTLRSTPYDVDDQRRRAFVGEVRNVPIFLSTTT